MIINKPYLSIIKYIIKEYENNTFPGMDFKKFENEFDKARYKLEEFGIMSLWEARIIIENGNK